MGWNPGYIRVVENTLRAKSGVDFGKNNFSPIRHQVMQAS